MVQVKIYVFIIGIDFFVDLVRLYKNYYNYNFKISGEKCLKYY